MGSILSMFFILFLCINLEVQAQKNIFNVVKFGAKADGKSDDSKAFYSAWKEACNSNGQSTVWIPKGTYKVQLVTFDGPCKGQINVHIEGALIAPSDGPSRFLNCWIGFKHVDRLNVNGGGSLDGQGPSAWSYNTCSRKLEHCKTLATSFKFEYVTNSIINNITSMNSKGFHMSLFRCSNISISNVKIQAPDISPNTDGIHISNSNDIQIFKSKIATGDDCISVGPGSRAINITNIKCGPGHGISIGSLGRRPNEEDVYGITVKDCNFISTMNGVRIKTASQPSYPNTASKITFDNIHVNNVSNPIIIDQYYCPHRKDCKQDSSKVKISDVTFNNIWGMSKTKIAVDLECSQANPCQKIVLRDINMDYHGLPGKLATSFCSNVQGEAYGKQKPPSCIKRP